MSTFYVDMQTGAQLSASQLVPGKTYVTSGTGAMYTAPAATSSSSPRTAVTLGNGQVVYYDTSGQAWTAPSGGSQVSNSTVASSTAGSAPAATAPAASGAFGNLSPADQQALIGYGGPGMAQQYNDNAGSIFATTWLQAARKQAEAKGATPVPTTPVPTTTTTSGPDLAAVNAVIDGLEGLDAGQKAILKEYAKANFTKNPELAQNIMTALATSTQFSTPQFKQQAAMLMDGLKLSFAATEGDLAYREKVQTDALAKAEQDYQAALNYGTAEEAQQLKQHRDALEADTLALADQMAASGFTSSSKRNRSTQILNEQNQGLVESTTRKYGYERAADERTIAATRTDTAAQLANLQRLAEEGKLGDLRKAEGQLGTDALASAGYDNLLGGQVGSQNYDLTSEIVKGASNFVF